MRALILAMAGLVVSAGTVQSFEEMGLSGGMTLEAAQSVSGVSLTPIAGVTGAYFIDGTDNGINVTFCDGRLASMTKNIPGGLDAFISEAQQQQQIHGPYSTTTQQSYETSGLVSQLQFDWNVPERESVSLSLYSIDGVLVSSVALTHSARLRVCP